MYTIAIIGAGQLGSRHLQGLKKANLDMNIEIIDPDENALAVARERYEQIADNQNIVRVCFLQSISDLSDELDLVIIATSAAPRFDITVELIQSKNVKNILFEKVLFQKAEDYAGVEKLLEEKHIHAWVNCPRRMFDFYRRLKEEFSTADRLIFNVSGGDWGIGCNSIHFMDCLAFLSNTNQFTIDTSLLDREIYPSKRVGYVEFSGILSAVTERGDHLTLTSQRNSNASVIITIQSDYLTVVIDEVHGILFRLEAGKWSTEEIHSQYQSQLTGCVAEQILLNNMSQLTEFSESKLLHLAFIQSILAFYNRVEGLNSKICPVT